MQISTKTRRIMMVGLVAGCRLLVTHHSSFIILHFSRLAYRLSPLHLVHQLSAAQKLLVGKDQVVKALFIYTQMFMKNTRLINPFAQALLKWLRMLKFQIFRML